MLDKEFLDLTLQDVADRLVDKLQENKTHGKNYSCALLNGTDDDGNPLKLTIVLSDRDVMELLDNESF